MVYLEKINVLIDRIDVQIMIYFCFEDFLFFTNSADPDEMLLSALFVKVPVDWFQLFDGLSQILCKFAKWSFLS